ncbi:MAG: FAD-binding oxidoreductase [Betaproteobacteria bacterium]|nr:FAD-binding oxidoreductase [Betaproteobacteria bacterium]
MAAGDALEASPLTGGRDALALDLIKRLGKAAVLRDTKAIRRFLRDNSWLSPILSEHFNQGGGEGAPVIDADMVVTPENVEQLRDIIALAVRHNSPIVVRGGGTTNFGQSIPLEGGVIIDSRKLNRVLEITDTTITAEAGAFQADVDARARERSREMKVVVTTQATATVAGWVGGGHVGLGGTTYGTIWDGNVLGVKLLTAEDPPREISLRGDEVALVIRTSGTTGVITEVTFPLVPACRWLEAVVVFDGFGDACKYVDQLSARREIVVRAAAAQEAPLPTSFTPITKLFSPSQAVVVLIVDAAHQAACENLAAGLGGIFHRWQITGEDNRLPMAFLSYGHRMLWVKKIAPNAGFLNCYLSPDRYREQFDALKREFGDGLLLEHKLIISPWVSRLRGLPGDTIIPAPLITVVQGDRAHVEAVMKFCDTIGVGYQNPHTFSIAESGMFPDFQPIVDFAHRVDPKGLLNPGKLHGTFFASPAGGTKQ